MSSQKIQQISVEFIKMLLSFAGRVFSGFRTRKFSKRDTNQIRMAILSGSIRRVK